jgi:hypothetical protein
LGSRVGVEHDRDPRKAGRNFLEQTKRFAANREFPKAESSEIAARLSHARNEALRDGSATPTNTTGTVRVSRLTGVRLTVEAVKITSGINPINSAAYVRASAASPAFQRTSMRHHRSARERCAADRRADVGLPAARRHLQCGKLSLDHRGEAPGLRPFVALAEKLGLFVGQFTETSNSSPMIKKLQHVHALCLPRRIL